MKQRFVCLLAALAFLMLAGCGGGTLSDNKACLLYTSPSPRD